MFPQTRHVNSAALKLTQICCWKPRTNAGLLSSVYAFVSLIEFGEILTGVENSYNTRVRNCPWDTYLGKLQLMANKTRLLCSRGPFCVNPTSILGILCQLVTWRELMELKRAMCADCRLPTRRPTIVSSIVSTVEAKEQSVRPPELDYN